MPRNVISPTPPQPRETLTYVVKMHKHALCLWEVRPKKCAFSGRPSHQQTWGFKQQSWTIPNYTRKWEVKNHPSNGGLLSSLFGNNRDFTCKKNWEFNTEKGNVRNHPAGSNPEYGDLTRNNGHHTNKKQQSQVRKNWIVWGCLKIGYPIPSPSESPISISNWPVGIFRHTQKHNTLSNFDIFIKDGCRPRLISCFPWVLYKTRLMILG